MATISGEVRDENNDLLADCVVRAYRRDTGALLASGLSGDGSAEVPGDDYYNNVVLLLHCDGTDGSTTFTDSSPTPKTFTAYGNAHIETDRSKFGGACAAFDGTGDLISTANNAAFNFGTGDFTIEFWLNTPIAWSSQPASCAIIGQKLNDASNGWQIYRNTNQPTKIAIRCGETSDLFSTSSPTIDTWEHWAVVRYGTTLSLYKNGTLDGSTTNSTNLTDSSGGLLIGKADSWATSYLNGYLDDIRITKGVARYTANFTAPTAAFPDAAIIPAKPIGEYTFTTAYTGEVQVIALDPDGGTTFNDLILRTTPV